jgi:hypothetical protein
MSMRFVLIIIWSASRAGGITSVDFGSMQACEAARDVIAGHYQGYATNDTPYIRKQEMFCFDRYAPVREADQP